MHSTQRSHAESASRISTPPVQRVKSSFMAMVILAQRRRKLCSHFDSTNPKGKKKKYSKYRSVHANVCHKSSTSSRGANRRGFWGMLQNMISHYSILRLMTTCSNFQPRTPLGDMCIRGNRGVSKVNCITAERSGLRYYTISLLGAIVNCRLRV